MVTILQDPRSKPARGLDAKYAWLAAAFCGVLMGAMAAQAAAMKCFGRKWTVPTRRSNAPRGRLFQTRQ